jgi:hypothetical protein
MPENDPPIGFDEILAVIVDFARGRAAIVEGQDLRGDPLRVEAVTDGVGAQRGDEDVGGTDGFVPIGCQRDVGESAQAGDGEPNQLGEYRFRDCVRFSLITGAGQNFATERGRPPRNGEEQRSRINAELRRGFGCGERFADWKPAIRQVGNLRYKSHAALNEMLRVGTPALLCR